MKVLYPVENISGCPYQLLNEIYFSVMQYDQK